MARRVYLLCEDRRAERFLRRLCKHSGVEVLDANPAPRGKGSAENFVRIRYPEMVKKVRSKNFQRSLGLIVHIDGDNQGFDKRCRALDQGLKELGLPARGEHEPIAVFVPTWCIETWLLHLSGKGQPGEDVQVKEQPPYRELLRAWHGEAEAEVLDAAAEVWPGKGVLPSLRHAVNEARKVGIG